MGGGEGGGGRGYYGFGSLGKGGGEVWLVFISQLDVCQEGVGVKDRGTWRTLRVPDQRHGGHGMFNVMRYVFIPKGIYTENLVVISYLKVCQESEVKKGDIWWTMRVPDQRHGGQGHP